MNTDSPEDKAKRRIRQLIWLYFWLLLIEGALRKWVLPDFSNPLLVVRDPVALAIYFFSIRARVFPSNLWVAILAVIGFFTLLTTFVQLWIYIRPLMIVAVSGYGFRSNYFHLPLIFVMATVLRPQDVKKIGWWTLVLLVPMTLLMIAQFRAAPDALVNRTAGGEGEMMMSALGKVRTAGTFSFVTGVVAYFALATGYLVWALLKKGVYKNWLLIAAAISLLIGISISGSRSVVGACVVVVASLLVVIVLRPDVMNRFGQVILVTLVVAFIVGRTPIFKEGLNVLSTRVSEVAEATDQSVARGLVDRVLSVFEDAFFIFWKAPLFGYGLGIGTNAGAKFLVGRSVFLLSEGEWSRILLESGPVFGLGYLIWRCAIAARVGWLCLRSVRVGNILPLLLFCSGVLPMISGQFGQPTILGFAVFATGLALAARNEEKSEPPIAVTIPSPTPKRTVRGRSAYAERLHSSGAGHAQSNGSVDR